MSIQKERSKLLSYGLKLIDYRNKNWLTNQSVNLKKSPSDIAKMCNVSIPTINKWLVKFNITKKTPLEWNNPKMIPDPLELKEIPRKSIKKFKNGNDNFKKSKEKNIDTKLITNFKKAFIGNPSVYSYCNVNGKWTFAKKGKITSELIEKHLQKKITLGSYYAYKQHNKEYCRYICHDYDLHPLMLENGIVINDSKKIKSINKFPIRLYDEKKKKINEKIVFNNEKEVLDYYWDKSGIIVYEIVEQKNEFIKKEKYRIEVNESDKLKNLTKEIRNFLISSCKIPKNAICREISGRGYHIWIFLKNLTTLKRAYDYGQYLNKKILQSFGIECEIFPKQDSIGDGIGNFVKLPLSVNRKANTECIILDNFDYNDIKGFKIDETVSKNDSSEIESITVTTQIKTKKESKLAIGSVKKVEKEKLPKIFDVLLECHRDVLNHTIDIAKYYKNINTKYYKDTKGTKEFEYWKELFWQVYTKLGVTHDFLYTYLEKQSHFNKDEIETQVEFDYNNYRLPFKTKDNPKGFIKASVKKLYPDYPKKQSKKTKKEPLTIEETNEIYGDLHKEIPLDKFFIEIRENGVYKGEWEKKGGEYHFIRKLIMHGKLDILYKTIDNKGRNLFTFNFNNNQYNTHSIEDVLKRLPDKIYKGNAGRDIIKHCFNVIGDELENKKAEYITGFNNGWKLPQSEIEKQILLVCYTDYQTKTYNRAKNIIREYSVKEKEKIKQKLKEFIDLTQTEKIKLTIIIAWSMSAPFRLAILEYCDIFPHLYNYGERNTGKSSLEKFWIVHFYKIYENYLSSIVLESDSRLEDHATESTFPHNIQECHKVKNINAMPLLKDIATGISAFDRKKSAREVDFEKPKTAGFCLDSNNIVSAFKTPAFNTKCITNEFTKNDVIKVDLKWRELYRELKKEKLFSFVYEITKDWNNKIVFKKMDSILNQIKEILKEKNIDFEMVEKGNPRIISFYQIILFGIELFYEAFDIKLEKEGILKALMSGRQILSLELKDQFFAFCKSAVEFDEGYIDDFGASRKGDNPRHLQYPLELDKDKIYYCFTQNNLRDFNEYSGKRYYIKDLNNLVVDALANKEDIQYVNKILNGIKTRYIQIKKDLF